jgi:hypothetical protein
MAIGFFYFKSYFTAAILLLLGGGETERIKQSPLEYFQREKTACRVLFLWRR